MSSKHDDTVLRILSVDTIKSTNEILKELELEAKVKINWHALYRILTELAEKNHAEKLQSKAGFFWRKKE